jgi:hypothetical protein
MRRVSRFLISVAGALLIVPLVVAAQAVPANAATETGKLLVTTIARGGNVVTSQITIVTVSGSSPPRFDESGSTLSLPDGAYYVLARILGYATTETLAASYVTVRGAGTARTTLNASGGKPLKVTVDGTALSYYADAQICADGVPIQILEGVPGTMYVVPSTSRALSFGYLAQNPGVTVGGSTSAGIPSNPGGAWSTSQLAKVSLTVRGGESAASSIDYVLGSATPPGGTFSCESGFEGMATYGTAPYSATEYVSPGYWGVGAGDSFGGYSEYRQFAAGHSYSYTYYPSAWAPSGQLPLIMLRGITDDVPTFTDPYNHGDLSSIWEAVTLNHLDLYLNGHLLASAKVPDRSPGGSPVFTKGIAAAGWYTLTDTATRDYPGLTLPASLLSPEVTLDWRFYASPSENQVAAGFWTSFEPKDLSDANSAAPGSTTTVIVDPYRPSYNPDRLAYPSDSVAKLRVWSSTDGAHWKALTVHHSSGGYYVDVKNPATGFVYLRAEVTGSHDDTSTETVYKAYAIS